MANCCMRPPKWRGRGGSQNVAAKFIGQAQARILAAWSSLPSGTVHSLFHSTARWCQAAHAGAAFPAAAAAAPALTAAPARDQGAARPVSLRGVGG
eukprot:CAMPEP_0179225076 /NCGR_PEP_ID=MMETSP0797-20121207/8125_1 /TAXON_ID=47934 /ORGANISM="Dinophysis acuminata, Strain DAEP01" /LENGTH=95 /DNA_ID=CAMNT_0020932089 /DNA_START=28 /DNA_END=312 /DNA_ORIENTATION=+